MKKTIKRNIQAKKEKEYKQYQQVHKEEIVRETTLKQFFGILGGLTVLVTLAFLFTKFVILKDDVADADTKDPLPQEVYNHETILAGNAFTLNEREYMVLFSANSCSTCSAIKTKLNTYKTEVEKPMAIYGVDMDDVFNKTALYDWTAHAEKYGKDDKVARNNKKPATFKDLKIASYPTLLVVKDGKTVSYLEGNAVETYINSLLPEDTEE